MTMPARSLWNAPKEKGVRSSAHHTTVTQTERVTSAIVDVRSDHSGDRFMRPIHSKCRIWHIPGGAVSFGFRSAGLCADKVSAGGQGAGAGALFRRDGVVAGFFCAIALGLVLTLPSAKAAQSQSVPRTPLGTWLTATDKAVVRIIRCGHALCGEIAGLARPPGEPMPTDFAGRPQCGQVILHASGPNQSGAWMGRVTDPRDGESFGARLRIDNAGDLHLRGFLGIPLLGRTVIWHPYSGTLGTNCRMS